MLGAVRILIIGSGGREHALVARLLSDPTHHDILCASGNAGIASDVPTEPVTETDPEAVTALARTFQPELVVVGPEAPLMAGVTDALRAAGFPVFGPSRAAAQIEGSKNFAKDIMRAAGVPTARDVLVKREAQLHDTLAGFTAPYVVKADGLAAGKGVLVTEDAEAAADHARTWLARGQSVLFEEYLAGEEVSLFFLSDGTRVAPLSPAQDYKRLRDGDLGPNTGGMGAYSPLPWLPEHFVETVQHTIAEPTIAELGRRGTPFVGLLYCGLIVTTAGIRVIEFNARFGDPETQVVLPRLRGDFGDLLLQAATGHLHSTPEFSTDCAITVVLASEGYPEAPLTGRPITGLAEAAAIPGTKLLHAATAREQDALVTTGGRVLNVVATAATFPLARSAAYAALARIHLDGAQHRTDIGSKVSK
jgi:phosphoribosylamine--glycine ligase